MKNKAQGNLVVAQILLNKNTPYCSNASVHCSYYAVFQYMKYMLATTSNNPIGYREQDESYQNQSSHEALLSDITSRIRNESKARAFRQKVRDLRNYRVTADYQESEISLEEGLDCKQKAENCISNLKEYFGNI